MLASVIGLSMHIKIVEKLFVFILGLIVISTALADASAIKKGSSLYKKVCFSCHDSGLVNAPRLGDKIAWNQRIAKSVDTLTQIVISGKNAMPPRGGSQYTDVQIKQVILFMISKVK